MTIVDHDTRLLLNDAALASEPSIRERFATASPFPHVVVDDVLRVEPGEVLRDFPTEQWEGWHRYRDEYQRGKLICSELDRMPPLSRALVHELCAPAFLEFLEGVTGIARLLPDPYLEGGGLHASGGGATLTPHTDFHVYTRLGLYRQVNVLLYLNPDWQSEDGGALELFDPASDFTRPVRSVDPIWGRMVVFRTDDGSPHGFTRPVAEHRLRRSIALYYYTATETRGFAGGTTTHWKTHGDTSTSRRRIRLAAYRTLLTGSRALSMLAHRCNPNLGPNTRPERGNG